MSQPLASETSRAENKRADYSWLGNLVTTLGLLIGVFIILANRPPAKDEVLVEPSTLQEIVRKASETSSPNREAKLVPLTWPVTAPPFATVPMTTAEIQAIQQQWADYLGVPVEYKNTVGICFVLIPPGEFRMGGTDSQLEVGIGVVDQSDEHWTTCYHSAAPQHTVRLTRPYYLSRHEITQQEYAAVMLQNPSWYAATGSDAYYRDLVKGFNTNAHPVEGVTWLDCVNFCNRLSELENRPTNYISQKHLDSQDYKTIFNAGYRLPTEAEWEMGCRAGTASRFWRGEEAVAPENAGWHGKKHGGRSHRVGEQSYNALGLHDMSHNVWEWVDDCFDPGYYETCRHRETVDPIGGKSGTMRVVRGGMWPYADTASFDRYAYHNDYQCNYIGFRVVLPLPDEKLPSRPSEISSPPLD